MILGGEVQETSKNVVLKAIAQQDVVQEVSDKHFMISIYLEMQNRKNFQFLLVNQTRESRSVPLRYEFFIWKNFCIMLLGKIHCLKPGCIKYFQLKAKQTIFTHIAILLIFTLTCFFLIGWWSALFEECLGRTWSFIKYGQIPCDSMKAMQQRYEWGWRHYLTLDYKPSRFFGCSVQKTKNFCNIII